jgi:hypothetical protein
MRWARTERLRDSKARGGIAIHEKTARDVGPIDAWPHIWVVRRFLRSAVGLIGSSFHLWSVDAIRGDSRRSAIEVGVIGPSLHLAGMAGPFAALRKVGQIGPSFALQVVSGFRNPAGQTGALPD